MFLSQASLAWFSMSSRSRWLIQHASASASRWSGKGGSHSNSIRSALASASTGVPQGRWESPGSGTPVPPHLAAPVEPCVQGDLAVRRRWSRRWRIARSGSQLVQISLDGRPGPPLPRGVLHDHCRRLLDLRLRDALAKSAHLLQPAKS